MAIVEDYIPDSDDEDLHVPSVPVDPPVRERPVKQQQSNGHATKGSTLPELVEQLSVPEDLNDTLKASELSESIYSFCRVGGGMTQCSLVATAHVEAHQRRIKSALQQLAAVWPRTDPKGDSKNPQDGSDGESDVRLYIAVTRLRGVVQGPDGTLITPEILQLVEGEHPLPSSHPRSNISPRDILNTCPQPTKTSEALLVDLKSVFASKPHPDISVESGRRLMRPVGGEAGRGDLFDDQTWKEHWGTWNTLRWCIEVMSVRPFPCGFPLE